MEILIFLTGGTIAMGASSHGAIPSVGLDELLTQELKKNGVKARTVLWAEKPSPHITPNDMLKLARDIDKALEEKEVVGAVVSHGTDLLAESAFVLDLLLKSDKGVVCTGSMRHMEEAGYDGLRNIINSAKSCLAMPRSSQVLLQLADKLYTARDAIKIDSVSVDPFIGQQRGSVGRIAGDEVKIVQDLSCTRPIISKAPLTLDKWVPIISSYPGMGEVDFLKHLAFRDKKIADISPDKLPEGLVVEAFGAGNVPPGIEDALSYLIKHSCKVVISTRCVQGGVVPLYGYKGGGRRLSDMGAISAGFLSALKAQLLLKILLASNLSSQEIKGYFK